MTMDILTRNLAFQLAEKDCAARKHDGPQARQDAEALGLALRLLRRVRLPDRLPGK